MKKFMSHKNFLKCRIILLTQIIFLASYLSVAKAEQLELRIGITAAFVSESGIYVYNDIANYLGNKLNRDVSFVTGLSYSTVNEMIDENIINIGFVCGLPYTMKRDVAEPKVELLVAPVMKASRYQDKPIYFSDIIVHKDSPFQIFEDLRGKVFVYSDEISNSGYNMPRAHLISLNETEGYFSKVLRSGSHEESIHMVASGLADISAVDSLVLDYDLSNNNPYATQVRIITSLGPAGIPPVIISNKLDKDLVEQIQTILVDMDNDEKGRVILDKAGVKRFEKVSDHLYDSIREMNETAYQVGYTQIR